MDLNFATTIKWLAGILATIFLGALGSGLWNHALEPIFTKFFRLILNLSTLGINSLKDNLYYEASKGKKENITKIALIISVIFIIFPTVFFFSRENRTESYRKTYNQAIENLKIEKNNIENNRDKIYDEFIKINEKELNSIRLQLAFMTCVLLFMIIFKYFKIIYTDSVVRYFYHCKNICLPYFENNEESIVVSRFSLMTCRSDFVEIINFLEQVATRGEKDLPPFSIY